MRFRLGGAVALTLLSPIIALTAFGQGGADESGGVTLTFAAYSTPREAFAEIIPLFEQHWLEQTGQKLNVQESYGGSGAQSRAVVGGLEADVVDLSLEGDVARIAEAGLITTDWQDNPHGGFVTDSVVALAVRPGNPKGITDWADLTLPGLEVLTPDPATSGGARWNVMAAYGAAARGHVQGYSADETGAAQFLSDLFKSVSVLDATARDSILNFENGIGDVAITYENEIITGRLAGSDYETVYPSSTILIENPIAVVDVNADKHGVREAADAFVRFTYSPEAQIIFARHGYRPVVEGVLDDQPDLAAQFAPIDDLFTIRDFGGWSEVDAQFFSDNGIYTTLIAELQG